MRAQRSTCSGNETVNSTSRLVVLVSIAGLFVWLFADALFGSGMFVFRDAAHFYYPLFQFIADEWAEGRLPLWNPYENLGMPLAGNPAASVFYPGKLIFALPISYAWAYKIYIMGHLLLAAGAAYRLARHWHSSVEAAGLCAVSYAFSGNVLFTYCNVVFLVGAAWLPLAMLAADRMLREGRRARSAVGFGVVLAMMVLGGDPQMAYNAALLAALYALLLRIGDRRSCKAATSGRGSSVAAAHRAEAPAATGGGFTVCASYVWPLVLAALVGLALSAVQVLPSMEFTRRSDRSPAEIPDRLLCRIEPGTHQEHTYDFSVGPWRLVEYLWPNVGGRQFPAHRRWLEVIPAEGRIWTPTLYMGLLPLLMAVSAMRLRRGSPRGRWLSWSVVLAVVASFGSYGLGWLVDEVRFAAGAHPAGIGPLGGLYWLMTVVLPGYAYFRYPAKLLVVAALGLSVLASRGFDRVLAGPSERFRRGLLWLGGASLCGAAAAVAIRPFWSEWLGRVEPDSLFGPLDTTGAADDLLAALLQTAVLCGLSWWLLRLAKSGAAWVPTAVLLLSAVDLAVANRWVVATAPASQWQEKSKLAAALQKTGQVSFVAPTDRHREAQSRQKKRPVPFFRVLRRPDGPAEAGGRMARAMRWDLDTLWPKYNLTERIPLAEVQGTMMPHDYDVFLKGGQSPFASPRKATAPLLVAKYVILSDGDVLPAGEPIAVHVRGVSLWHNPRHLPRAWIVHQVEVIAPLESHDPARLRRRTAEVLYSGGRPRDLRRRAVVEADLKPAAFPSVGHEAAPPNGRAPAAGESCRVVDWDPLRVEIEAELTRPGLVVLCDQFYPGWKLEVETAGRPPQSAPILRTNRVMRGAWLPEGRHRLTYSYRPGCFAAGAVISALGWIGLIVWGFAAWIKNRRRATT